MSNLNDDLTRDHLAPDQLLAASRQLYEQLQRLPEAMTETKTNSSSSHTPSDHPTEDAIYELAVGLLSTSDTELILNHVSCCDSCSAILKTAIHDFDTDPALEKDSLPAQDIKSATPTWQSDLASQLQAMHAIEPSTEPRAQLQSITAPVTTLRFRKHTVLWIAAPIAAMLLLTAPFGVFYQRNHTVDRLLATAYNTQRLTELRIPGAQPVPLYSPNLGDAKATPPTALLELKLRAQRHLEQSPNDAYWRQITGKIALLEGNGEAARNDLVIASSLNPTLPDIQADLADAYFEIAQKSGEMSQYAHAADRYGRYIDTLQSNDRRRLALAFYNRALCWERLSNAPQALADYRSALTAETDPAWRTVIQARINHLQNQSLTPGHNGPTTGSLNYTPAAFLHEEATASYESYLAAATESWLPQRSPSPKATSSLTDRALAELARSGVSHHDLWLTSILRSHGTPASQDAIRRLTLALADNRRGDAGDALSDATTAAKIFYTAGNAPGYLRARIETIYSLQRLGRSRDCLEAAEPLEKDRDLQHYSWLYGYFLLTQASCQAAAGYFDQAVYPIQKAIAITSDARLPIEKLRAESFLATLFSLNGQTRQGWSLAVAGLTDSLAQSGASMRSYQFLSTLYFFAKSEDLSWAAVGFAQAAVITAANVDNRQIQAYANEELGIAETAVDHLPAAAIAFKTASASLEALGNSKANAIYQADWTADRADLLALKGELPAALDQMRQVRPSIDSSDNQSVRQHYFAELGHLLYLSSQYPQSIRELLHAVHDAEHALPALKTRVEQLTWQRDNARAYKILVQAILAQGDSRLALRAWEWYRSAPYRINALSGPQARSSSTDPLPGLPTLPNPQPHELLIVLARLDDTYVAWSVSNASGSAPAVREVSLPASRPQIAALTTSLSSLIEDPTSPQSEITAAASTLFLQLLSPFAAQIGQAHTLRIDLDPTLQSIPVGALQDEHRAYLAATHPILILPPWWSLHPLASSPPATLQYALIVAGRPILDGAATAIPIDYDQSSQVAARFPHSTYLRYPDLSANALLHSLRGAQIFHFTGHAIERNGVTGLFLTSEEESNLSSNSQKSRQTGIGSQHGVLNADAIAPLSLHRCWLSVLAGCSTRGRSTFQAEDPQSLVHALLTAGASHVIATQWDVDAHASSLLTLRFYDALLTGHSPAEALQIAQSFLLASPRFAHPAFWAAYQTYTH